MIRPRTQGKYEYFAKMYGIPEVSIVTYNSGICYSTIWVTTKRAANKVAKYHRDRGDRVIGGYNHGDPLGTITKESIGKETLYRVIC